MNGRQKNKKAMQIILKPHLNSEKSSKNKQGQKGQCLFGFYCIFLQTYHESICF